MESVFGLLGGLALFLYGMQMMSENLEAAAGSRMKQILERLTSNRLLGVFVGAGITAIIQSSSATTVMAVGFVNSGLMTLQQAVWIIMGANIGTTVTGQLIALDLGALAPLIAFIGVALTLFIKRKNIRFAGGIVAGLGILFLGMGMMSDAMVPLRDSQGFIHLMTKFSNPVLGIAAGAGFTALIQSSSASVGILQALAISGLIGLDNAVFVLFGQNIGTCITAVLASIGANRDAKRTTVIHLMFNLIGTVLFTAACLAFPLTGWVSSLTPGNPAAQIANMHTLFNIVTTVLLLPFGKLLAHAAEKILPDKKQPKHEDERWLEELLASEHILGVSAIAKTQIRDGVHKMLNLVCENVDQSFLAFSGPEEARLEEIRRREEEIDVCNARLSRRISRILSVDHSPADVGEFCRMFTVCGNLERIGDHAKNIAGYAGTMAERQLSLSDTALNEITEMRRTCMSALALLKDTPDLAPDILVRRAGGLEQDIDDKTDLFRSNQIERMRIGECNVETSILYSEILTDYERIGDHVLNIARALAGATPATLPGLSG